METVNNMAAAAAKAVWGENESSTQEPVSGQKGNTSEGEPYDAGNIETKGNTTSNTTTGDTSTTVGGNTASSNTASSDTTTNAPKLDDTSNTASSNTATSDTTPNPQKVHDSSKGPGDSTQGQNDVRDPEDPQTHPDDAAKKSNVDDSTGGTDDGNNPAKVDGPGPKPIDVVAKEHGGDAGNSSTSADKTGGDKDAKDDEEDDDDGPQKKSHGEGTGEKYIKSSGLQADGGDFDAANAGAGKEADRLLEEKGIHHSGDNHGAPEDPEGGSHTAGHTEKPSFGDKIKSHLHKNKQEH